MVNTATTKVRKQHEYRTLNQVRRSDDKKLASDIRRIADKLEAGEIGAQEAVDLFELALRGHVARCSAIIQLFS